ncbi:MAG: exodeoxyribonuclease III [Coraliomargaritaceae bacterium]
MTKAKSILSWNVNGIRAVIKKGFEDFLTETNHDIVCLQETKISDDLVQDLKFKNYPYLIWNCAEKKGYSGTAIFSKEPPLSIKKGIGIEKHDKEGRVITAEFEDYYLVTVYTPNAQNHDENRRPKRLDYRTQEWDVDFLNFVTDLEKTKPVIFCGDLNVAHQEIDLANPKTNRKNAGFTDEERESFQSILDAGYVDIFRQFHPDTSDAYTWWSYRANARTNNVGWRIDYFCVSQKLQDRIASAESLTSVLGSDHCPITISFK